MRRAVAIFTASLLFLLIVPVASGGEFGHYKDRFGSPGYSGSDGNLEWSGPWKEQGESDGHTGGKVRSVEDASCPEGGSCLVIEGGLLALDADGAARFADLSRFEDGRVSFKMNVVLDGLLGLTDATLYLQARANGSGWDTLESYSLALSEGHSHPAVELDGGALEEDFGLRFVVSGLLGGDVYIDYVEVSGEMEAPTTTSTTSTTSSTTTSTSSSTTTSNSSTTTTKATTTTTTRAKSDPAGGSTTTTSEAAVTTGPGETTTTVGRATTTTTGPGATTTTAAAEGGPVVSSGGPPPDSGIRQAGTGLQADYREGAFGDLAMDSPQVLGVELDADYSMAVELIESSWVWMLGLAMLIATAIVSGMDRRRAAVPAPGSDAG